MLFSCLIVSGEREEGESTRERTEEERANSEERVQRNQAEAMGKMGGRDKGPTQRCKSVAWNLQHRRGSRQSLRCCRQAHPW